jgi:PAS domain-containing protein
VHHRQLAQLRREELPNRPAMALLNQLPALDVLEWLEFPILALGCDGSVVFANWAFADVIGLTPEMVMSLKFRQIFDSLPEADSPIAAVRANAGRVTELMHLDGSKVLVKMSECLLLGDYEVALATFEDITDNLWNGSDR